MILKFFFGELRTVETSYLYDQFVKRVIGVVLLYYFLSIDITNKRAMGMILFPIIFFLIQKLAHKRMEFLETSNENRVLPYLKLITFYFLMLVVNTQVVGWLYDPKVMEDLISNKLNMIQILNILTVFEFLKMTVHLLINIVKFIIHVFLRTTKLTFEYQDTIFKCFNVIASVCSLGMDALTFLMIIAKTDYFPIFLIGNILNSIYEVLVNIKMLYIAIIKIKKLNNIMDITREEIEEEELDHTCVICQDDIETGKILDCKHIFHLKCLKKWVLNESSCPICKRDDVIFVDEDKICNFKAKLQTKRNLLKAGVKKEKFNEEINKIKEDSDNTKKKYSQLEKKHLRLQKRREKRREKYGAAEDMVSQDSDSEDTEQMIIEVKQVEKRITYMMSEIAKAKKIIEKYDVKLTKRLQKKHKKRLEEKRQRDEQRATSGQNDSQSIQDELSDAAFLVLDKALEDLGKKEKLGESPSDLKLERQMSKPIRLGDYDIAPMRQNSESSLIFEANKLRLSAMREERKNLEEDDKQDKFSLNAQDGDFSEQKNIEDTEEKSLDDENSPRSAPGIESKNPQAKMEFQKSRFLMQEEGAVSQINAEVKSIAVRGSVKFNLSNEPGHTSNIPDNTEENEDENVDDLVDQQEEAKGRNLLAPVERSKPLLDFATSKASDGLSKVEEEEEMGGNELGSIKSNQNDPEEDKSDKSQEEKLQRNDHDNEVHMSENLEPEDDSDSQGEEQNKLKKNNNELDKELSVDDAKSVDDSKPVEHLERNEVNSDEGLNTQKNQEESKSAREDSDSSEKDFDEANGDNVGEKYNKIMHLMPESPQNFENEIDQSDDQINSPTE